MNQTKRELEACTDQKEKEQLEKRLFELRVDLNYILVRFSPLPNLRVQY